MNEKCDHCDDHSGHDRAIGEHDKKLGTLCVSNRRAHERIDLCVTRSTFQWIIGIMVVSLLGVAGANLGLMLSISSNLGVLTNKVVQIEKQMDSIFSYGPRNERGYSQGDDDQYGN
jgi:hypothetical protein